MDRKPRTVTGLFAATVLFSCLVISSGCSFIERNTVGLFTADEEDTKAPRFVRKDGQEKSTSVAVEGLEPGEDLAAVEIVWTVPDEEVDGYVIYYGTEEDRLTDEKRIAIADLSVEESKDHGKVYRYLLQEVPEKQDMYVAVAAFRDELVSERSQVFEVENP